MKKCPKCGETYDDTWKVCMHCSVELSENLSIIETNPELRSKFRSASDNRSKFVTIVAWIFIVIAGFTTLISILQNVMVNMLFPMNEIKEAINQPEAVNQMPAMARFMFSNIRLFFFGFFVLSLTTLISSIGLLKRKNWARLVFIAILVLGIIWNLSVIFLQGAMMPKMSAEFAKQESAQLFQNIMLVMRVFTAIIAIGMSVLFGWVVKKLVSINIKQEFIQN